MALAQVLHIQIRTEPSSMILSYLFIERAHRHTALTCAAFRATHAGRINPAKYRFKPRKENKMRYSPLIIAISRWASHE